MPSAHPAAPELLRVEHARAITHVQLRRPAKRNALNDALIAQLRQVFTSLPATTRAVVLSGEGEHFCAGLDLSSLTERSVVDGITHSRSWHHAFEEIQFGRVPVVAVLKGAVVGGGLELASAAHIRVAEVSTFYALPEGQRGLFVGGGGSARIPRLIGAARMADMMLTGRVYAAEEGARVGLSQYVVPEGAGLSTAFELAEKIASNAPLSNFAVLHALPRIAEMGQAEGLFAESLMAAIAQGDDGAKTRMKAFLEGKGGKVKRADGSAATQPSKPSAKPVKPVKPAKAKAAAKKAKAAATST
ncbi:MAG TPA: crotonase/enoyl-CoA hydratase family protein [Burkholderiaceae bacterium]|nr:crotonase/enoyl-CoA hydratase family protein [Burkholderiaceae bacterium]